MIHSQDLDTVFLAAPTTTSDRLSLISEKTKGFLYYVSRTGVTGAQATVSDTLESEVENLRGIVGKPIVLGFGISNPDQAKQVSQMGDGIVIGSALVKLIEKGSVSEATTDALSSLLGGFRTSYNPMGGRFESTRKAYRTGFRCCDLPWGALGSGIFVLPGIASELTGPSIWLAYAIAGFCVLPAAVSKSELSTAMPTSGGTYIYIERTFGPLAGTVAGIGLDFIASEKYIFLVGFGAYLAVFTDIPVQQTALGLLIFIVGINLLGVSKLSKAVLFIVMLVLFRWVSYYRGIVYV